MVQTHAQTRVAPAPPHAETLPRGHELIARARERLARELATLEGDDAPLDPAHVSFGAQAHLLRRAYAEGRYELAREIFISLLERIEGVNRRWAQGVVARTPGLRGGASVGLVEDLRQELTLRLWEDLTRSVDGAPGEAWELFFQRALDFAQRHTATAVMEQRGYWRRAGAETQGRALARLLVALASAEEFATGPHAGLIAEDDARLVERADPFAAAELADLRALVLRLPPRERRAVALRYWQRAPEAEIAQALGGVTTRTVRAYLRSAERRLRQWYEEGPPA